LDIIFASDKFRKLCNNHKSLLRRHGPKRAQIIRRRLDDLLAATVLEDMRNLPGRCHELKGDKAGQLSLDLDHPYRLVLQPTNDPAFRKPDGGLNWSRIAAVVILGVEDTHE
jgi:plasmid maintenance system killer protein